LIRYLLDVNVLLALIDPDHTWHSTAHEWFEAETNRAWATCPLTENGVLRIAGNSRYPNTPGSPGEVAKLMVRLRHVPGHDFWPDDVSLLEERYIDTSRLTDARQITDTYLLALASSRNGKLATFDKRLVTNAVRDGKHALHVIA